MDKTTHEVRLIQWQEIFQAQLASGQNKREWCRENGISEKQFFYWQRRVRKELYESQVGGLVSVTQESAKSLVEVPLASASSNTVANGFNPEAVIAIPVFRGQQIREYFCAELQQFLPIVPKKGLFSGTPLLIIPCDPAFRCYGKTGRSRPSRFFTVGNKNRVRYLTLFF